MLSAHPVRRNRSGWFNARLVCGAVIATLTAGVAAYLYPNHHSVSYAIVGIVAVVGVLSIHPAAFAVLAVPGVLIIPRLAGGAISGSDAMLAMASVTALFAGVQRRLSHSARLLMGALALYLVSLSVTLIANQDYRGDLEWLHRLTLVGGSVIVGIFLVERGLAKLAVRLLLMSLSVVAVAAMITCARHGFAPAYPLGMQKNFAGSLLATSMIVVVAAPAMADLNGRWRLAVFALFALGLLATQSRGSMLDLLAGLLIWFFRTRKQHRRGVTVLVVIAAAGMSYFVYVSVARQLSAISAGEHINSLAVRQQNEATTRQFFYEHKLTGVGLRYYKTPRYAGAPPPNNLVDEVLAEAGIPGLVGFIALVGGSILALRKLPAPWGTVALGVVVGRFLHGAVDIYWVAGTTTLAWLMAGMALGHAAREPDRPEIAAAESPQPSAAAPEVVGVPA